MTDKLKCPVCQQELRQTYNRYTGEQNPDYECGNFDCDLYAIEIPENVWKAVIKKLEALKIATKALEEILQDESDEWFYIAKHALEQIKPREENVHSNTKR